MQARTQLASFTSCASLSGLWWALSAIAAALCMVTTVAIPKKPKPLAALLLFERLFMIALKSPSMYRLKRKVYEIWLCLVAPRPVSVRCANVDRSAHVFACQLRSGTSITTRNLSSCNHTTTSNMRSAGAKTVLREASCSAAWSSVSTCLSSNREEAQVGTIRYSFNFATHAIALPMACANKTPSTAYAVEGG